MIEEEQEPLPLAVEIAERAAERRLGRDGRALVVEPGAQVVEDGASLALTAQPPFLGGVAGELGGALDSEQTGDLVQALERELIARPRGVDQAATAVGPAPQ